MSTRVIETASARALDSADHRPLSMPLPYHCRATPTAQRQRSNSMPRHHRIYIEES